MPPDDSAAISPPLPRLFEGQTVILKGANSPASCQTPELNAVWWYFLINPSRPTFCHGHRSHSWGWWEGDGKNERQGVSLEQICNITPQCLLFALSFSAGALNKTLLAHSANDFNKSGDVMTVSHVTQQAVCGFRISTWVTCSLRRGDTWDHKNRFTWLDHSLNVTLIAKV